jgi:DNA ligase-1
MKFAELAEYFQGLEKTASRNLMTEMLSELFKAVSDKEIQLVCYLSLGGLRPKFDRLEMQLADRMVVRGLADAFEIKVTTVWREYKKVGDLGQVAQKLKQQATRYPPANLRISKPQDLSITQVYEALVEIAGEGGQGSQERKLKRLVDLIHQLEPVSVKYVVRIVLRRLRLGFSDMTILDALAVMDRGTKTARSELETSYQVFPDVGKLAQLVKQQGISGLTQRVRVVLGVPVVPALCQRLKTADEMIKKMGRVIAEPKFDGTRVQIHIRKQRTVDSEQWTVKTFTRNLDETTAMFPELEGVLPYIQANEVILDSEAVGVDPRTGRYLPFQETITRKRKHDIAETARTVPLKYMTFDVLYKDGVSLIAEPLSKRRAILKEIVKPNPVLIVDEALEIDDPIKLREYHQRKLKEGLEGVVVKQVKSVYEPGRRGWSWVKFKEVETSQAKLADTIDAVVMGFYRGKGKRARFGIGAFLVGILANEELQVTSNKLQASNKGQIVTLAKIGTGLSDEQWREMKRRLEQKVSMEKPKQYVVDKNLAPDVWVDPTVVVEIAADEITKSPIHSAGWALRFPRLIRFRDDKSIAGATTLKELIQIKQASG